MKQTIENQLDSSWLVHEDSKCGRHWNPAIIEVKEEVLLLDGDICEGMLEIPVNSPRPLSVDRSMSMFARAYSSEISEVTKQIFAQHK